jgi:hypothetical protein
LDQDVAHLAGVNFGQKLGERDVLRGSTLARVLEQREQRKQQQNDDDPEREVAEIGIHPNSSFLLGARPRRVPGGTTASDDSTTSRRLPM